jgi:anaerobic ribonucleoside-triphosphate reductase activating protein
MKIAVNRLHYPVKTLGPGRRVGIWMQGCSIGCRSCMSRDTWIAHSHHLIEIDAVIAAIGDLTNHSPLDGITISGGEPFEQPDALRALLTGLRAWLLPRHPDADILCYSGLRWVKLQHDHADILALLDAIVPEPYVRTLPQVHVWRGSANQPLHCLTELARLRYRQFTEMRVDASAIERVQLTVDDQGAWMIGLPDADALEYIEAELAADGVISAAPTWR